MVAALRSAPLQIEWRRDERAVVGRVGAQYHHNTRFTIETRTPVIAGILDTGQDWKRIAASGGFERLNGFFAGYVPRGDGGLTVLADRRASVPIFFALKESILLFAPTVRSLLNIAFLQRDIDTAALASFLASGHLVGDQTLVRSVRRLRGGHAIQVSPGGEVRIERYWQFRPGSRVARVPERQLASGLLDRVEAAVARHVPNPQSTAIFLSGGADSRGLICAALRAVPADQLTAVTWSGEEQLRAGSDAQVAARVAKAAGVRHLILKPPSGGFVEDFRRSNELIDCLTDSAALHPRLQGMAEHLAERGLTTALRGDEAFGWWHPVESLDQALMAVGLRTMAQASVADAIRPELREAIGTAGQEALQACGRELDGLTPDQIKDVLYFEHRLQCYLGLQNMLMQRWLDHRNPLIENEVLDFMECVPDELRAHKLLYQRAMALRHPKLWGVGLAGQVSGSSDWRELFGAHRSFLLDQLEDGNAQVWDYIDPDYARSLAARVSNTTPAMQPRWATLGYSMLRKLRPLLPNAIARRASRSPNAPRPTSPARLLMRVLALKDWMEGCDQISREASVRASSARWQLRDDDRLDQPSQFEKRISISGPRGSIGAGQSGKRSP